MLKEELATERVERLRTIPGVSPRAVLLLTVTEVREREEERREITPELAAELEVNEEEETVEAGLIEPRMKIAAPLSEHEFESKALSLI